MASNRLQRDCLALCLEFSAKIDAEANNSIYCSRFLSASIRKHILPPSILPPLLLDLRVALFPGNARGPPAPEPPSNEERLQVRKRCAEAVLSLVPPLVSRVYFNVDSDKDGEDEMIRQVEEILDVFGDAYLNKHLVYNILELVIVRLVPELGESTPSELLSERGVTLVEGIQRTL
jgi:hypothetical protein